MANNELQAVLEEETSEEGISNDDKVKFQQAVADAVASRIQPTDNAQTVFDYVSNLMVDKGLGHYQYIGEVFEKLKERGVIRVEGTTVMGMWENAPGELRERAAALLQRINFPRVKTRMEVIRTIGTNDNEAKKMSNGNGHTVSLPTAVNLSPYQVTPENITQIISGLDLPEGEVTDKVKVFVSYFIEGATKKFSTPGMVIGYVGNHTKKLDNDSREKIVSAVLQALRSLGLLQQDVAADDPERLKKRIDVCGSQALHFCIRSHAKKGHIAPLTIISACRLALENSDIPVYLIDRAKALLKSALTKYLLGMGITPKNNVDVTKLKKEKAPAIDKKKISATADYKFDFTSDPETDVAFISDEDSDESDTDELSELPEDWQEKLKMVDPLAPTPARPGSEDKVIMLAARYSAGVPLYHDQDNKSQATANLTIRGMEEDEGEGSGNEDEDD